MILDVVAHQQPELAGQNDELRQRVMVNIRGFAAPPIDGLVERALLGADHWRCDDVARDIFAGVGRDAERSNRLERAPGAAIEATNWRRPPSP